MTTTYTLRHDNGATASDHETYAEAIAEARRIYGGAITPCGSWDQGGTDADGITTERELIWRDEATAEADQVGAKAVAEIIRRDRADS